MTWCAETVRRGPRGGGPTADVTGTECHRPAVRARSVTHRPAARGVSRLSGHAGECHGERRTHRDTLLIECHGALGVQRAHCHSQGDEARDAGGVERRRSCAPPELEIAPAKSATHVCLPQTAAAGAFPHAATPTQPLWCRPHCQRTAVRQNHGFGVSVGLCTQCE